MIGHELALTSSGLKFRCTATPKDGEIPDCWYGYDPDTESGDQDLHNTGHCNVAEWVSTASPIETYIEPDSEIVIPIGVCWAAGLNGLGLYAEQK